MTLSEWSWCMLMHSRVAESKNYACRPHLVMNQVSKGMILTPGKRMFRFG